MSLCKINISQMRRYAFYNISKCLFFCFGLSLFIISCNKTEPSYPAPEIHFITTDGFTFADTTLLLGAKVKIGFSAGTNSPDALTHINITSLRDTVLTSFDTGIYNNQFDYILNLSKGVALEEKWQFYVRDREGRRSETIEIRLKKDSASIFQNIRILDPVILGAQNNENTGSFFSFTNETVYPLQTAFGMQDQIHLLYFYDLIEADQHTISSPGANIDASVFPGESGISNWTVRNTLRFLQMENLLVSDFENCRNDSLIEFNTFVFTSGYRKAKNLVPGNIYAFVSDTGRKGLFLVKSVDGNETGSIEIAIKMEEE